MEKAVKRHLLLPQQLRILVPLRQLTMMHSMLPRLLHHRGKKAVRLEPIDRI